MIVGLIKTKLKSFANERSGGCKPKGLTFIKNKCNKIEKRKNP